MKQTPEQNKRLVLGDLMYSYRHLAELKGFLEVYIGDDLSEHKEHLDMSLESIKSAISLITESEFK